MAKTKKVRVVEKSPVYDSQGVEIGHAVEGQVLTVSKEGEMLQILDPCPWGAFGVMAHIPAVVVAPEDLPPPVVRGHRHAVSIESEEPSASPAEEGQPMGDHQDLSN